MARGAVSPAGSCRHAAAAIRCGAKAPPLQPDVPAITGSARNSKHHLSASLVLSHRVAALEQFVPFVSFEWHAAGVSKHVVRLMGDGPLQRRISTRCPALVNRSTLWRMFAISEEPQLDRVDVVILTAITLEYSAVLKVDAAACPGSLWIEKPGANGLPLAFRTFHGRGGHPLHVAVGQAGDMGVVAAATALFPLIQQYKPKCIAMSGVCAGRPKKTELGDVIAAERLFFHDTGKQLPKEVQQDLRTYNLREDWRVALEHFDFRGRFETELWWNERPIPYKLQEDWVLKQLHDGIARPYELPECDKYCPQWERVINALWDSRHVKRNTLVLTAKGQKRAQGILIEYRDRFPDVSPAGILLPFRVHVAPMGSGNKVVEDQAVWSFISDYMRKTLGLDMEAAAIGAIAHSHRAKRLDALVMKGVMDFANHGRDDHFKEFAARAAAECLIAFLREYVEVDAREQAPPVTNVPVALRSNTAWAYPDWERLIAQAHDAGAAFATSLTRSADCSEGRIGFEERVRHLIKSLRHLGHLPSVTPEHEPQLAVVCSKLERVLKRALPPGAARRLEQGIIAVQELLNKEVLPLLYEIYLKADRQGFHAPAERRK